MKKIETKSTNKFYMKHVVTIMLILAVSLGGICSEVKAVESHYFKIKYNVTGRFSVNKRRNVYFKGNAHIKDAYGGTYSNSRHRWQYEVYGTGFDIRTYLSKSGTTDSNVRATKTLNKGSYKLWVNNIDGLNGSNYLVGNVKMAYSYI